MFGLMTDDAPLRKKRPKMFRSSYIFCFQLCHIALQAEVSCLPYVWVGDKL